MHVLGIMSGTSLDGIDLALCNVNNDQCHILQAETIPYSPQWRNRLKHLAEASAFEYAKANVDLGNYIGMVSNDFMNKANLHAHLIASHGHTIFHQPDIALTTQIGDGDAIAAETGLPVVSNFRTLDVALGGQGAPLVPLGDEWLFGQYDACLNLGGIANISFRCEGRRIAFDICPCNMALNHIAQREGLEYDKDGHMASHGEMKQDLKKNLDIINYYQLPYPKSLGKEWFESHFQPLIDGCNYSLPDVMHTVAMHIAGQIAATAAQQHLTSMLITGGGAWNKFLIHALEKLAPQLKITIPEPHIVNYKEAMIFALLGYLRYTGQTNTLASVTGARHDSVGGTLSGLVENRAAVLYRT